MTKINNHSRILLNFPSHADFIGTACEYDYGCYYCSSLEDIEVMVSIRDMVLNLYGICGTCKSNYRLNFVEGNQVFIKDIENLKKEVELAIVLLL